MREPLQFGVKLRALFVHVSETPEEGRIRASRDAPGSQLPGGGADQRDGKEPGEEGAEKEGLPGMHVQMRVTVLIFIWNQAVGPRQEGEEAGHGEEEGPGNAEGSRLRQSARAAACALSLFLSQNGFHAEDLRTLQKYGQCICRCLRFLPQYLAAEPVVFATASIQRSCA